MLLHTIDEEIFNIFMEEEVSVGLILGGRRNGKSVLGYGIIDELHKIKHIPVYVFGLPISKHCFLPAHIRPIFNLDEIPDGSAFIVDEAYREFYARMSMSAHNKFIDTLIALSGQKGLKSIYISQQARRLDRGIVGGVDFVLFKKPSLMQMQFDRPQFRKLLSEIHKLFQELKPPIGLTLKQYQKQCTYVFSEDFVGMIENSNLPPSWWNEEISKAYAGVPLAERNQEIRLTEKQIVQVISRYIDGKLAYDDDGRYIRKSKRK